METRIDPRRRTVALATASSLAVSGLFVATDSAFAEAGRRICAYTEAHGDGENWVSVGMDYPKDRTCPVMHHKPGATGPSATPLVNDQPVPEIHCEDWPAKMRGNYWGDGVDVCTQMDDDVPYVFYVHKVSGEVSYVANRDLFDITWS